MLALFDTYDVATAQLARSLETAGVAFTPVVIRYDGDLPDGALCPFTAYAGIRLQGDPLFFDEVPVPEWCEIRQGTEPYAQILRDGVPLGRIHYEASSFRQVERVDWLLPDGSRSHTDHYDRYGNRYATTHYSDGIAHQTVYEGAGKWTIEVDHVSRLVTMRAANRVLTFASLTDFASFFLDDQRIPDDRVLINSLSYPLFVMRRRAATSPAAGPNTTLFWQEPMPGDPPENMALELGEPKALTGIVFFDDRIRARVAAASPSTALRLAYLSHLGQFAERPAFDARRAFTLTHTDEIPGLVELLERLPEVTFSVAALTLMSEKLHDIGRRHPNLTLIPSITHRRIREELKAASVYLDINAGAHVLDVVEVAYHLGLVVLSLPATAKAPDLSLTAATTEELAARLSDVLGDGAARMRALDELHTRLGPRSTPEDYRRILAEEVGPRTTRSGRGS